MTGPLSFLVLSATGTDLENAPESFAQRLCRKYRAEPLKWAFLLQEGCEIVLLYVVGLLNGSEKKGKFSSGSAAVLTGRLSRRSRRAAFTLRKAMNGEAPDAPESQ